MSSRNQLFRDIKLVQRIEAILAAAAANGGK